MKKPYVISAELDTTAVRNSQIINQDRLEDFRESLDTDLCTMGKETVWVGSNELQNGLAGFVKNTRLPVVSLDDRYVPTTTKLGISRGVDSNLIDTGYVSRDSYPTLEQQFASIKSIGREIVIADDVLFSGEMIAWLAEKLKQQDIKIGAVVCGIAIREGIEKIATLGIDVSAVREFDTVDDEICERDFAVVPGSGRRMADSAKNALYFDPTYSNPEQWASIPRSQIRDFAVRNYQRAANLLQPAVPLRDIGSFFGLPDGNAAGVLDDRSVQISNSERIS